MLTMDSLELKRVNENIVKLEEVRGVWVGLKPIKGLLCIVLKLFLKLLLLKWPKLKASN